jgi:hypothetical protein
MPHFSGGQPVHADEGTIMNKTMALGVTALALMVASCGSDGGAEVTGARADAAAQVIESAKAGGINLDEDCVKDLTAQLSDEDAEKLAASEDGDAELSAEGEALGDDVLKCASQDELVDLFISGMTESGETVDEVCARDALEDFDVAEIVGATTSGEPPADLIAALVPCLDLTGTTDG